MSAAPRPSAAPLTLVTGATGTTGSRVADGLIRRGVPVRAAARRVPEHPGGVRFDWYEPGTHDAALAGVRGLYLVPPVGAADPAAVMLPFLRRAREAGAVRAVLLSSSQIGADDPGTGAVHAALPGLFPEWAVLRPSWFMQNFTGDHQHARSVRADGVLTTATGAGRVAFIDADDIAAVAVHALTAVRPLDDAPVLTGPQALSYADVAAVIGAVTGRPVRHEAVSAARMRERFAAEVPEEFAAVLAALDARIADGAEDRVTPAVQRITGRPPRAFAEFAAAHAAAFTPGARP
ncbi:MULTISPECIES: ergot alkaloid biosynthesis protein [Streptomyces]|uniref:Ergot alkaloid biosynthesis protein n=1 Tax=Streptomyces ramulosus TaxID=47762 RepID=A0ABW1FI83_9ACTN